MCEKRTVYLAYGSNLNIRQMLRRCPDAKPWGATELADWKLEFWGGAVATIVPKDGCSVPVGLWSITARDERALDVYEDYPRMYRKEYLPIKWGGGQRPQEDVLNADIAKSGFLGNNIHGRYVRAMVYIMNRGAVNLPSISYFKTILDGYLDFDIDTTLH